ncbi:Gamma-aminobutyric acid receptor subunit beta [Araneus ventricosus]|uniref:Gamma-aminobutyric acid receptor subunit beta n=1 Tax=Araneus ventricosus TaxID=182803 RepID=A0A4Y2CGL8_ARAVE|nr:Gamma-aminobutyric acid receptor subunit beta [Araneus ventricosus]
MLCILLFSTPSIKYQRTVAASGDDRVNITKIPSAFFDQGYDKRVRPNYGGPPLIVSVTMFILSISSVSEVLMDFTLDFYICQAWTDDRLSFTPRTEFENLTVGAEVADRIWAPDNFFVNEKSVYFHKATTQNTFLRISAGGEVFRSIRLSVTAGCPMDLQYFPMDRQVRFLEIESFGYTMRDIKSPWSSRPCKDSRRVVKRWLNHFTSANPLRIPPTVLPTLMLSSAKEQTAYTHVHKLRVMKFRQRNRQKKNKFDLFVKSIY